MQIEAAETTHEEIMQSLVEGAGIFLLGAWPCSGSLCASQRSIK